MLFLSLLQTPSSSRSSPWSLPVPISISQTISEPSTAIAITTGLATGLSSPAVFPPSHRYSASPGPRIWGLCTRRPKMPLRRPQGPWRSCDAFLPWFLHRNNTSSHPEGLKRLRCRFSDDRRRLAQVGIGIGIGIWCRDRNASLSVLFRSVLSTELGRFFSFFLGLMRAGRRFREFCFCFLFYS